MKERRKEIRHDYSPNEIIDSFDRYREASIIKRQSVFYEIENYMKARKEDGHTKKLKHSKERKKEHLKEQNNHHTI